MTRKFKLLILGCAVLLFCALNSAHPQSSGQPAIQDNSFLVEEAYNQNSGVVQHINNFTRYWRSKDWVYTFTQEWPVPGDERHQLSYTVPVVHAQGVPGSGPGIGDVLLNYRYQLVGSGESKVAFAPRVSLIVPTGDPAFLRGQGGAGVQTNLPLSLVLNDKLVSHSNAGATFVPNAQNNSGNRAFSAGYNFGQSFIWLAKPRFNVLLETVYSASQQVRDHNQTEWARAMYLNPGIRWAYNFENGLQIVPGIAMPIGVGPSRPERAVFFYLSFEHPFRKISRK